MSWGGAQLSAFAASRATKTGANRANGSDSESAIGADSDEPGTDEEDPLYLRMEVQSKEYNDFSDREVDAPEVLVQPPLANIQLSTWTPNGENNTKADSEGALCIRLKHLEKITLIGQFDLWVKSGCVKLYGAILRQGRTTYRVFTPSTSALPSIQCTSETGSEIEIWSCSHTLRPLGKVSPLFRRIWNHSETPMQGFGGGKKRTFSYLRHSTDDPYKRLLLPLDVPTEWEDALRILPRSSKHPVLKALVCGSKGMGKSTFCRLLANRLVTGRVEAQRSASQMLADFETVFWLDLDPGQPEFSPPGQLSLVQIRKPFFGPPFTHPCTDATTSFRGIRAHTIAALSPREDPIYFLECVRDLLAYYDKLRTTFPKSPLIINCPGWVAGSGLELMAQLIKISGATDVVFMGHSNASVATVDTLIKTAGTTPLHKLPAPSSVLGPFKSSGLVSRSAPELRAMQNISYFHQLEPSPRGELVWSSTTMNRRAPCVISYSAQDANIMGILTVGEQPSPDFLSTVLLGSLVAICIMEDDAEVELAKIQLARNDAESLPYWPCRESGLSLELAAGKNRTLGLALIQQIDAETQTLTLQTPILELEFRKESNKTKTGQSRIVLVRGKLDTPGWAYLEEIYATPDNPAGRELLTKGTAEILEDLALDEKYVETASESELDENVNDLPWVKKALPGQVPAQRWRVRKDIGRPERR